MFCAHGAGTVIPWDRVRDYMHIDTGFGKAETQTPPPAPRMFRRRFDPDDRELEEILQREFGPIRRACSMPPPCATPRPARTRPSARSCSIPGASA
ncbi:MAG: hypothetical protein ACLSHG_10105 [Oscillospiraceae bacterium]